MRLYEINEKFIVYNYQVDPKFEYGFKNKKNENANSRIISD